MKQLPKLETPTLRVHDDIVSSDLEQFQPIVKVQEASKVLPAFGESYDLGRDGFRKRPLITISAAAVKLFHAFRWELVGDHEEMDERHRFGNDIHWLR